MEYCVNCYMYSPLPRLSLERTVLLKQQLSKMLDWLSKAEQNMKDDSDIGTNYETVSQQLEDHQVKTTSSNDDNLK